MPDSEIALRPRITEADLLSDFQSANVYNLMLPQATKHTGEGEMFTLLEWQPRDPRDIEAGGNPGMLLADFRIEPNETPGLEAVIKDLGEKYFPGFNALIEQFTSDPGLLDTILEKLAENQNVVIVTNHANIADIAVVLATMRVALAERATDTEKDSIAADRFNLIVHRMISQLGVSTADEPENVSPALSILQLVGETYLSFPRTESSRKNGVPPDLDKYCNDQMLEALSDKLSRGGQILAFAPSGSKDESLRDRVGRTIRKIIKPVNRKTYSLMQGKDTWVLGVCVDLDGDDGPKCSYGELVQCEEDEDCAQLLESIADEHTVMTGIRTIFARTHDDLEQLRTEYEQRRQVTAEPPREELPTAHNLHRVEVTAVGLMAVGAAIGWFAGRYSRKP